MKPLNYSDIMSFEEFMHGARTAVHMCMGIKKDENVLIITDRRMNRNLSEALKAAAEEMQATATVKMMEPLEVHGQEPPEKIAELMKTPDILFLVTSKSLSHTKARIAATEAGVRIASMPDVPEFSFIEGGLTADYKQVKKYCMKMNEIIMRSRTLRITSKTGTLVELQVGQYKWDPDIGVFHKRGDFGNLPAGEVSTSPNDRSVSGVVVFDQMGKYKKVKLNIRGGIAERIEGAEELQEIIKQLGIKARTIAEIGIGCNPKAKIIGNVLEDEKVLGTVHIGLGNNTSYGGKNNVQFHDDGIIDKPTLIADGAIIIRDGKWMI
jgi:leucyl aminopeptidase (aminopeptidase T)